MSFWAERDGAHVHSLTGMAIEPRGQRYSLHWDGVDLRARAGRSQHWHTVAAAKAFVATLVSTEVRGLQLTGRVKHIRTAQDGRAVLLVDYGLSRSGAYRSVTLVELSPAIRSRHPEVVEGCKVSMHCLRQNRTRGDFQENYIEAKHLVLLAPPEPVIPPAAKVWVSPERPLTPLPRNRSVFLGGAVESDTSVDWRAPAIEALTPVADHIFNPRRAGGTPQGEGGEDNPAVQQQFNWERDLIREASLVLLHLAPGSLSPITMMELGFLAATAPGKVLVCCLDDGWPNGNVALLCALQGIPCHSSLESMLAEAAKRLASWECPAAGSLQF